MFFNPKEQANLIKSKLVKSPEFKRVEIDKAEPREPLEISFNYKNHGRFKITIVKDSYSKLVWISIKLWSPKRGYIELFLTSYPSNKTFSITYFRKAMKVASRKIYE